MTAGIFLWLSAVKLQYSFTVFMHDLGSICAVVSTQGCAVKTIVATRVGDLAELNTLSSDTS